MRSLNADSDAPAPPTDSRTVPPADGPPGAELDARRASRRRFFAAGATLAAATVAGARPAWGQGSTRRESGVRRMVRRLLQQPPRQGFDPFRRNPISQAGWDSALVKLVRRVTNGVTQEELALARQLGFYGYLNYHLNWTRIDDNQVQSYVGQNFPTVNQDAAQLYALNQDTVRAEFVNATLYRAAFSKRQLYERMVEFFSDHFNIAYVDVAYMRVPDDRDVARRHALGKFPDMVRASAHSPAMLEYLDNTRNRGNSPNQNYARELMELHTVGVDGGYTQDDVAELSRCLTGWTIAPRGVGFNFDPNTHDFGEKRVMGQLIPAQNRSVGQLGKRDGDTMIDFLVAHDNTARFVGGKMLRWLLRYDPTDAQVDAVAAVYRSSGGDIPAMVRAILTPANLLAAPAKYRRPYTFVLAALRATNPNVMRIGQITGRWLTSVGQPLFAWGPPDGYPDRADYWAGGVLQRWNFASYLTTNTADAVIDINRFLATPTPDGLVTAINNALFAGEMPERLRGQLLTYAQGGTLNVARARETLALALGSSTFQWI
jgi:uncharacterized protein (DUF1800 family)